MNKNFQDLVLNQIRRDNMPIVVFLTSGFQIRGILRGFDNYVIILEVDGKHQMIYKHAISTIVPHKMISNLNNNVTED